MFDGGRFDGALDESVSDGGMFFGALHKVTRDLAVFGGPAADRSALDGAFFDAEILDEDVRAATVLGAIE
jgi:hypothetical protein